MIFRTFGRFLIALVVLTLTNLPASASLSASATYTDTQVSPGVYQYDLTLNDTGTTTIGTFWFSWIPGAGFMSATPTNIIAPAGWIEHTTNSGMAIQWATTTSLLTPGGTLSGFIFDSTETPAQFAGVFGGPGLGTGDPVATAFVYVAAPLADPGFQLVATQATAEAPEPSTLALLLAGLGFFAMRRRPNPGPAVA